MNTEINPSQVGNINLGPLENLVKVSEVHLNVSQEVIITTEDKVRLCLRDHMELLSKKGRWITPVSLFLTLLLVFATTNFHDKFIFSASTWQAVFVICLAITFIWSLTSIFSALKAKKTIDDLIDEIKQSSTYEFEIVEAVYGTENNSVDITKHLIEAIHNNKLDITASNTIAGDPDPGRPKTLKVKYRLNWRTYEKTYKEDQRIQLP